MASQINDVAGPGAIIRIDGFEGQQLPPKAQIKSMHVTRDQFAAETEQPGSTFVDVITQPGIGPIRGTGNLSFRDGSMNAKSQFTTTKGPEQNVGYGFNVGGAVIKQKSNFSLSVNGQDGYVTPNLTVATPDGARFDVLGQRQQFENVNINGLWDYALTRDQTFRFGYSQNNGRATQPGHRRLRPAGARVHVGQQRLHVPRTRSGPARAAGVHQLAGDDDLARLRQHGQRRSADDRRAGCVHQRRRAAERPGATAGT